MDEFTIQCDVVKQRYLMLSQTEPVTRERFVNSVADLIAMVDSLNVIKPKKVHQGYCQRLPALPALPAWMNKPVRPEPVPLRRLKSKKMSRSEPHHPLQN